jgi:hypothetical protein
MSELSYTGVGKDFESMARWWNPRNAVLFSPNVNEECFKGSMLLKMDSKISIHRDAKARQRCHAKQNQGEFRENHPAFVFFG